MLKEKQIGICFTENGKALKYTYVTNFYALWMNVEKAQKSKITAINVYNRKTGGFIKQLKTVQQAYNYTYYEN